MSILESVKRCVIGAGEPFPPNNLVGDMRAACRWDCYRRASMLEPMVDSILREGVPGDFLEAGVFKGGIVTRHLEPCFRDRQGRRAQLGGSSRMRALPGFFEDSLPGPVWSLALLRVDGDLYSSITATLEGLWPLLTHGGYVVFDDWKFEQSRRAIMDFRALHKIDTPVQFANGTLDPMAWWQKE